MIALVLEINKIIDEINKIYQSNADWKIKYDLVFTKKQQLDKKLTQAGLYFDYLDPDTTYQDDVEAYVEALLVFQKNLGDLISQDDNSKDTIQHHIEQIEYHLAEVKKLLFDE